MSDALQRPEIDDNINERILIGNGLSVAQIRAFNAQIDSLRIDALGGGPLFIEVFVRLAIAIQLIAQPGSDADRQDADTPVFGPVLV